MKIKYPKNLPLIKLPAEVEFTLFLIKEELKSRKLSNDLKKIGFDPTICTSDFSPLIFAAFDFNLNSDSFYDWYVNQLDVFCKDIDLSNRETLTKEAFSFYIHLMMEKKQHQFAQE